MKPILAALFLVFACTYSIAQTNQLDAKLDIAKALANDGKLDEAEKQVQVLLKTDISYGDGWDFLAAIRYSQYEESKQLDGIFDNISVTVGEKGGKQSKKSKKVNDSLYTQVRDMMKSFKPSEVARSKYLYTLRKATALSKDAVRCSYTLRALNVDVNIDSNIGKKALSYYNQAEELFGEKSYDKAAMLYRRAIEEQPNFYKASLYLGDCYYFTENYGEAIKSFKAAIERFPSALEPRKYLIDALGKVNLYDKAIDEAIYSLTVYPDNSILQKLEDALYLNHQVLKINWTPRGVLPNRYIDTLVRNVNQYKGDTALAEGPWIFYEQALGKAKPYSNLMGVLKSNSLTTSPYLEVYSWEEMLKNSKDPLLDEARRMDRLGYLDCYVLVSCFHSDLYPQYRDFVSHNRSKIINYYKAFVKSR